MAYTTVTFIKSGVDDIKRGMDSRGLVKLIDIRESILLREDDNRSIDVECYQILGSSELLLVGDFGDKRLLAVTSYSDLYKLAMTYTLGADIRNYVQLDRIDIICGVAINPEFAVRVMS